jgi:plasmid maintenance system antidote protein VapI
MEQLAEHLDISRSALSAKINNKREFTIREAVLISKRYKLCCTKCVEIFGEGG